MLENIKIVLVNTSHPGNIGSAARAMKTMGLSKLWLVAPLDFPHEKATALASGAVDVLEQATVVDCLQEAIADCHLVVGTSSRSRTIPWPQLTPRELGEQAFQESRHTQVAIVFGREQTGLTNEELHLCHFHVHIPSNPDYSSLNLAAAVQVLAYEVRVASESKNRTEEKRDFEFATAEDMEGFYQHLEEAMLEIRFLNPKAPRQLMPRLRRLFHRARLDVMEMNILRGIFAAMIKKK